MQLCFLLVSVAAATHNATIPKGLLSFRYLQLMYKFHVVFFFVVLFFFFSPNRYCKKEHNTTMVIKYIQHIQFVIVF